MSPFMAVAAGVLLALVMVKVGYWWADRTASAEHLDV